MAGLEDFKNFDNERLSLDIAVTEGLQEYATELCEKYKNYITAGKGETRIVNTVKPYFEIKESGKKYLAGIEVATYWKYIEFGRRPGAKFPPPFAIMDWIDRKKIFEKAYGNVTKNQLCFLISRKIARDGIEPSPWLQKSVDELKNKLNSIISEKLATFVNRTIRYEINSLVL